MADIKTKINDILFILNKSNKEHEIKSNDPKISLAYDLLKDFQSDILNFVGYPKDDFILKSSVGKGKKASSPWIAFILKSWGDDDYSRRRYSLKGVYITFIFSPEKNGVFIAIQGSTESLRRTDYLEYISS